MRAVTKVVDAVLQVLLKLHGDIMPTLEHSKLIRNNLLKESDIIIAELYDETEINRWKHWRELLRNYFVDKPTDFDYEQLVWPKSPRNIDALKEKAAAGDEEAKSILAKEAENGSLY